MEHEVFVPVPADRLRRTLADPARVARCVPGLQRDADASAGPLAGRLKVRVGGHTITYRGALRITERDGGFTAEGEGTEARGHGSAKVALTVLLTETEGGTTLSFTGSAHADGRLAEAAPDAAEQSATRLLDRFAASLATAAQDEEREAAGGAGAEAKGGGADATAERAATEGVSTEGATAGGGDEGATAGGADEGATAGGASAEGSTAESADDGVAPGGSGGSGGSPGRPEAPAGDEPPASSSGPSAPSAGVGGTPEDGPDGEEDQSASLFEADVPPSSLDPLADEVLGEDDEPPAEAAHARRTMIGRSAEEVDHAPPRGRYAPVPAPQPASAGSTLRWVAPAAALAIASAVVVGRALRRRR